MDQRVSQGDGGGQIGHARGDAGRGFGQAATAYFTLAPDPQNPAQRVSFGASGHRGSAKQIQQEAQTTVDRVLGPPDADSPTR